MEINNTKEGLCPQKSENNQKSRWLVGTIGHYVGQSLNKLGTFVGWGLTRLCDGCKSLFSRATTTTKTVDFAKDHVPGELAADKNDTSVLLNDQDLDKLPKENDEEDEEESHKKINIKEENYEPLPALGLNFSFAGSEQAYSLEESQQTAYFGECHIKRDASYNNINKAHKRVGFNDKVSVLLFDEEESPAELQNRVKSFKEIDFSDKGRDKNEKMIRKSSYEVADEFKSLKGSDLKKSFFKIGDKVVKKSK